MIETSHLDIRYVRTGDAGEDSLAHLLPQLTPDEQTRAAHFHFLRDKLAFAVGRVLLRRTVSEYAAAPPSGWQLIANQYGKPELPPAPGTPRLQFNISHCQGLVAVGFAVEREIGVDVEFLERGGAAMDIARSHFAPAEVRVLESLPEDQRPSAFFAFWTLKEAYIKARGMGLSIPLADFAFQLDPPRISFSSRIADQPERWFFRQVRLTPTHLLAVAARRHPPEDLILSLREIPLECLY